MDQITIRSARLEDARSIASLDVETWRATYAGVLSASYLVGLSERRRELGWRSVILREPRDVRVAVGDGGLMLGFGSCGPNRGDRRFAGEVFTLYVAPDWQNQGVGRRLLIALFRRLVAWQITRKTRAFGGSAVAALAYGWRDLPGFLAAASSEDREPES